jgi:hypothetical protein
MIMIKRLLIMFKYVKWDSFPILKKKQILKFLESNDNLWIQEFQNLHQFKS